MSEGFVSYSKHGNVATIVFDRPEAHNAMTWTMYQQLVHHCEALDRDTDVKVAVLRGQGGRAFVAGTDITQFTEFKSSADGVAYERRIDEVVDRLERVRVPTIAVVDGYAIGGGLVLAAACDVRIATEDAHFGVPIARTLGNCLSIRNYARLVHLIGGAKTAELIYTAELLDAVGAKDCGLVARLVPREDLEGQVADMASRLVSHAPITMSATKEALRRLRESGLPDATDLVSGCYGSRDFAEGVAAFIEGRKPEWRGE